MRNCITEVNDAMALVVFWQWRMRFIVLQQDRAMRASQSAISFLDIPRLKRLIECENMFVGPGAA